MSETTPNTASGECGNHQDLFTPEFKRLKAKISLPDLSGVVDLSKHELAPQGITSHVDEGVLQYPVRSCGLKSVSGVRPCEEWKCYQFPGYPGLIVIQNPFIDGYQRYWVYRGLQDFPSDRENVTNLTSLGDTSSRDLWQEFVHKQSCALDKQEPLRKLRWTTLGYHYNWTTKEYSEDHKAPFPADVNCLSQYLAACLGFAPYQAEASIVNYYHLDSTLAGHTDHSEIDQSAPLFSISFGQTAIFLLGGHVKSVRPMSVFLRSGDICIMSGECRLAYHAVPKILAPPPDKPIPSCFTPTHVCKHVVHDTTTTSSALPNCCTECERRKGKETNGPSFSSLGNNSDVLSSTDSCSTHRLLESEDSQKEHHTTSAGQIIDKSTSEKRDDNQTDKEYVQFVNSYNSNIDTVNCGIRKVVATLDFTPFEVYLKFSRINLNIRQVLPTGCTRLQSKHQMERVDNSSHLPHDLSETMIQRDNESVFNNYASESDTKR